MPTYQDYKAKYDELGSARKVAQFFGVHHSTVDSALKRWEKHNALSPGIKDALEQTGLQAEDIRFGYRRVKDPSTGSFNTVFWRAPSLEPEKLTDVLRELLTDIPPAPQIALETHPDADLLTLIPVADAHIGLLAWEREAGEDWDTHKGAARLTNWIGRALHTLQPSGKCILLFAGDLFHADDTRNETPANKHKLDVASRYLQTLEMVGEAVVQAVDMALTRHETVVVRFLPGNHDPHATVALMMAMAERYREHSRVTVQREPSEFFVFQFGEVLIAAHHGHRAKAPQMVHFIADEYATLWGKTKHRYLFTGHMHHHKSQDIGGMTWEQLPAITARDAYTVSNAYVARARLTGVTYHRNRGEIARIVIGPDL
jgi:hypothetical protein